MKRTQIKRTPLSDTVLASLEPEAKIYRVSDGNGLYFRVKPTGQKSWELRYKKADGKWSWLGLGTYPSISGAQARKKVRQMQLDASYNNEPIASKKAKKQAKEQEKGNTFEKLTLEWFDARKSARSHSTTYLLFSSFDQKLSRSCARGQTPAPPALFTCEFLCK